MKFDRETIIGIVICALLIMLWGPMSRGLGFAPKPVTQQTQKAPVAIQKTAKLTVTPTQSTATVAPKLHYTALPKAALSNGDLSLTIDPNQGDISEVVFKRYFRSTTDFRQPVSTEPITFVGPYLTVDLGSDWQLQQVKFERIDDGAAVIRQFANANGQILNMEQRFILRANYLIDCQIKLFNYSAAAIELPKFQIDLGSVLPWSTLSGDKLRTEDLNIGYYLSNHKFKELSSSSSDKNYAAIEQVEWASLSNKYFSMALTGGRNFTLLPKHTEFEKGKYAISLSAGFGAQQLAGNSENSFAIKLYVGPKEATYLSKFAPGATDLVQLAWGPINYLAKFLLWILNGLHALCGSYGWSIILLTLLVRGVFFPITQKANESMRNMQLVQPQLKALREQYKDNPQMMNVKMMELYRKEKINPLGGCLPILLQIPVFIALYATLDSALQLRHVSFWWCYNLTSPDTVASWHLPFSILGIQNFNLNPLVIVMTALMLVQQHLTPTAMEPMQKRMMTIMPLVMLFILYELPSGLTLYWTVSNIFSIFQMLLQQKLRQKQEQAKKAA